MQIQFENACNVHSGKMQAKVWPSFYPMNVLAHRICAKEPSLVIKQSLPVMSRGQYRLATRRKKLFGLSLFALIVSLYNWSILIFHSPSESDGAQWLSIIKTSPFFHQFLKFLKFLKFFHQFIKENHQFIKFIKFHKIFFFGPRPSIQKITNANTNTNEDRKDDLHIFHREMITNLTPCWQLVNTLLTICWHLADNCTSVTPCWPFVDTLLTIVQV